MMVSYFFAGGKFYNDYMSSSNTDTVLHDLCSDNFSWHGVTVAHYFHTLISCGILALTAGKFSHGGWSWNEADILDVLAPFLP